VRIYRLVDQERAQHAVSLLCSVLAVSRQAYYDWRGRPPSTRELRDVELKALIVEVFDESRRSYGAPRIAKTLRRKRGQPVATKRIARLIVRSKGVAAHESRCSWNSRRARLRLQLILTDASRGATR
jgi:putative transposase